MITVRGVGTLRPAPSPALAPWVEYLQRLPAHERAVCLRDLMAYGVYARLMLGMPFGDGE